MNNLLTIATCVAIAGACAYYAKKQNRNPYVWFLIGLVFGIFGLFVLFLIPLFKYYIQKRISKKTSAPKDFSYKETGTTVDITPISETETALNYLEKLWYYLDKENNQFGPMSYPLFKQAWKDGKIQSTTYVWNEELSSWKRFDELFSAQKKESLS